MNTVSPQLENKQLCISESEENAFCLGTRQQRETFGYKILCIRFRQEKLVPDINQPVLLNHTLSSQKAELSLDDSNLSSRWISLFCIKLFEPSSTCKAQFCLMSWPHRAVSADEIAL